MKFVKSNLTKLIGVYELPELETPDDFKLGSLRFVVEVLFTPAKKYGVRVLRKDHINVEPAYYENSNNLVKQMTVVVNVEETSYDWETIEEPSEESALSKALTILNEIFNAV